MSAPLSVMGVLRELLLPLALFEGLLLCAAGIHQWVERPRMLAVAREFLRVPAAWAKPAVALIAAAELATGVLLWLPGLQQWGAGIALFIFMAYTLLVARAVFHGRTDIDCGCSFGAAQGSLGFSHLVRNLLLLVLAASTAAAGALVGWEPPTAVPLLGAIALLTLYAAADQVLTLRPLRAGATL